MTSQRNSLNGRTKFAQPAVEPVAQTPITATGETEIKTTPKVIGALITVCVAAAIMWVTLSLNVSAHGVRIGQTEGDVAEIKREAINSNRQIEKLDDRTAKLEEWRKEMEQQRADIKAIRAMLEQSVAKKSAP